MKKTSKLFALILCLVLCVTVAIPALAAEVQQEGLKLTLTTDKAEYTADEEIRATLKAENTSAEAIKNLTLKISAPSGFTGGSSKAVESLAAGGSETLEVTLAVAPPKTGDAISVVIALAVVSGIGALALCNRKAAALMLALVMVAGVGLMAVPASAAEDKIDITTTVKVDGKDVTIAASVAKTAVEEPDPVEPAPEALALTGTGALTGEDGNPMEIKLELNLDLVNNTATFYEIAVMYGMDFYLVGSDKSKPDTTGMGYMMFIEIGAGTVTAEADGSYTATFDFMGAPLAFSVVKDTDGTWSTSAAALVAMTLLDSDTTLKTA